MNCPNCNRPNPEGLAHCDYCGESLTQAPAPKRKTEAEGFAAPPAGAPKRKTEIEVPPLSGPGATPAQPAAAPYPAPAAAPAAAAAPLDPFDPSRFVPAGAAPAAAAAFRPAPRPDAAAQQRKRATEFDAGSADPFAPGPAGAARAAADPARAETIGRRVVGWLVTFDGNPDGSSFVLREGRNVIGRDAAADIPVGHDPMVSGTHAYLIWRAGRARVADANTQNGTFLNEEDVLGQVEVKDNDVVRCGRTRFIVRLLDQERVASLWKPSSGQGA